MLSLPEMEDVRSINPLVGETNDGHLNDMRSKAVKEEHVFAAIEGARSGPVEEGSVGAGTGTRCLGWKGGIGTSSRVLPERLGGWTIGVIVQTNFLGILSINGAPVGRELNNFTYNDESPTGGSCMIVVATDAPLDSRDLRRLAMRASFGLARTGGFASNGGGDYAIAFSTSQVIPYKSDGVMRREVLSSSKISPLFCAVVEATEEAIIDSLMKAETVEGLRRIEAIPIDKVKEICERYKVLGWNSTLPPFGESS